MTALETGIAVYLDTAGLVDYRPDTSGGDCYTGWLPDVPDAAVQVLELPGVAAEPGLPYDYPGLQVLVRGERGVSPAAAVDRARTMWLALHGLAAVTLPGGVYLVALRADQSGPVPLGRDADERELLSLNFTTHIYQPSTHRSD